MLKVVKLSSIRVLTMGKPFVVDESLRVIPVCVYLRKNYPAVPPMCFVGEDGPSRTKLMTETVNVDRHGRVHSIPFVDEWKVGSFDCLYLGNI